MLKTSQQARLLSRTTLRPLVHRARPVGYATSTSPRPAAVLPSTAPPTPSTSASPEQPLRPQPFIPKPLSRTYQIASLAKTPDSPGSTTIQLSSGSSSHALTVPNLFLRDASTHPAHVHPASQQKLFRTTDVPLGASVVGYGVHEIAGEDHLVMEWSEPVRGVDSKSAKLSVTPLSLLVGLIKSGNGKTPEARPWTREELEQRVVKTKYSEFVKSDKALLSSLEGLLEDGIVFLDGVPTEAKEGQATELRKVVQRIGTLRSTWYGDLFDVKAEQGSKNIAYTNLDLGLHMDLTHFESPPRYQFLHSLLNTAVTGGSSYFLDSFAIAEWLRKAHPSAFTTLVHEPLLFSYKNGDHYTRFTRPVIELVPGSTTGRIHAVNYSPPFQGPLVLDHLSRSGSATTSSDEERLEELHEALTLFAQACDDPQYRYDVQLQPGDCVVFDNRRVLHARTSFEFSEGGGRWLKGAYIDGDEARSKWRVLDERRAKGGLR